MIARWRPPCTHDDDQDFDKLPILPPLSIDWDTDIDPTSGYLY
jgi:hypothetical protein